MTYRFASGHSWHLGKLLYIKHKISLYHVYFPFIWLWRTGEGEIRTREEGLIMYNFDNVYNIQNIDCYNAASLCLCCFLNSMMDLLTCKYESSDKSQCKIYTQVPLRLVGLWFDNVDVCISAKTIWLYNCIHIQDKSNISTAFIKFSDFISFF